MLIFSFFVPAVQAIYRFLLSEFQLNTITSVIGILSDNNRYRVDFGYNNVNTIGNLASGLIILSGLVVYVYNKEKNRCLLTIVCVCDIILLIEVLASGSRNAYNTIGILGMSMFISQLVAGIGETSIMYYAFPMSFVFFITYAGIINGVENEVKYK